MNIVRYFAILLLICLCAHFVGIASGDMRWGYATAAAGNVFLLIAEAIVLAIKERK